MVRFYFWWNSLLLYYKELILYLRELILFLYINRSSIIEKLVVAGCIIHNIWNGQVPDNDIYYYLTKHCYKTAKSCYFYITISHLTSFKMLITSKSNHIMSYGGISLTDLQWMLVFTFFCKILYSYVHFCTNLKSIPLQTEIVYFLYHYCSTYRIPNTYLQ